MHLFSRTALIPLVTMTILLAGGCVGGGGGVIRSADEPFVLQAIGPVEIDVESFNGDVIVETDEYTEWATVTVTRGVTHGFTRFKDARASLAEINYSIRMVPGEVGPRLEVRTTTDSPEPHFHRAHVHITVPGVERLHVRTTNGHVRATGISGPVDIETTRGDVRIMTELPMHNAVRIVNENGNIDYRVRGESTGRINAETVDGKVIHRIRRGRLIVNSGTNDRRLYATLNDGENPIMLRTMRGNIRVAVVQNPKDMIGRLFID